MLCCWLVVVGWLVLGLAGCGCVCDGRAGASRVGGGGTGALVCVILFNYTWTEKNRYTYPRTPLKTPMYCSSKPLQTPFVFQIPPSENLMYGHPRQTALPLQWVPLKGGLGINTCY